MADINDVARALWVIENFDRVTIDPTVRAKGAGFKDSNNNRLVSIRYEKDVDGTVYVTEGIGENKKQIVRLIGAYMEKSPVNQSQDSSTTQVPDAEAPDGTPETLLATPYNQSISEDEATVKSGEVTHPPVNEPSTEPPVNPSSTPTPVNTDGSTPPPQPQGTPNFNVGQHQWGREGAQQTNVLSQETKDWLLEHNEYIKDTNADQLDRAISWVESHITQNDPEGFYNSLKEVEEEGFNSMTADGQMRILTLLSMAQKNNDHDAEVRLSDIYNQAGTDPARALQARKIFRLMTPAGRKLALEREAKKVEEEYRARGKKGLTLKVSEEILNEAANARSEKDFVNAQRKMERELALQIPSDWRLKVRTWRMAAMLANPRTHIRNLEGNFSFILPMSVKNTIGMGLERMAKVPAGERTKSVRKSKEATDFAKRDAIEMRDILQGTNKYFEVSAVEANRKAFGQGNSVISKTLGRFTQWAADKNGAALEKEDWISLNRHYVNALSGYMTANGYTEKDMKGETLKKARAYAVKEAQKATYRDANRLAKWFSDESNKPAAVQFLINAVIPFTKTPMNIVRRGVEYSPFGLAYSLATARHQLQAYSEWEKGGSKGKQPKNAKSPGEVFDRIAAGLTGTMIAGLGAFLSSIGVLKVKPTEAEKRKGSQDYSLEIGGKSIGIGNLLPTILPLLFGASVYEEVSKMKGEDADLGSLLQSFSNMVQPSLETTMWMSFSSLLDTGRYITADESAASVLGQKIIANYASSLLPSAVGALAKHVDPTKRKAYVESGDPMYVWSLLREQTENKIPYLSKSNVPYLNRWGEEETESYFMSFLHNFILPDRIQDLSDSELDDTLEQISKVTGIDVEPNVTNKKSVTVNGEDIKLNDKQWYEYSSLRGQYSKPVLQELIERPEFITLPDESKAKLCKKVYMYANAKADLALFPEINITDPWTKGALTANNVVDYIFEKAEESAKEAAKTDHRESLYKAISNGNIEAARVDVDALRTAGVQDSSIKSSLTNKFKPIYKVAYEGGNYDEMGEIRGMLKCLGLGYENYDFTKWLK